MPRLFIEKVLAFLATLAVLAVPIIIFPHRIFAFNTSKSFFFMGIAEICFFLWICLLAVAPEYRITKKQIAVFCLPALLLLSLTISGILAPSPNLALWSSFERGTGLIFLYHSLVFGLVIASLIKVRGKAFAKKMYCAIFLSGIILAISAFVDQNGLSGNSSFTGACLIFSFFIGGILLFGVQKVWQKILISIGLIIILASPIIIGARGAALGIGAGILIAFFIYLATNSKKIIRNIGVILLFLALAGTVFAGISFIQPTSAIHNEFIKLAGNTRFIFWNIAIKGIKERPTLGWGLENYSVVYAKYFDPSILEPHKSGEATVDKPHNMILELFVAGGFIGGMLFLLFLISFFALAFYLYKKKIFSRMEFSLFVGLFSAYFLQDLIIFDTVSTYMMIFAIFGVFTGSILPPAQGAESKLVLRQTLVKKIILACMCVLLFIPTWIFFAHLPSKKAKAIYTLLTYKTAQKDFSVLTGISPMGNGVDVGNIGEQMIKSYQNNLGAIKQNPKLIEQAHADINSFLAEADKLEETARSSYALWLVSAQLANFDMVSANKFEDAEIARTLSYVARAKALSPNDPRVYFAYGQIYTYKKEFKKAHDYFIEAYNIDPKIPASSEYLDKFEKLFGTKF